MTRLNWSTRLTPGGQSKVSLLPYRRWMVNEYNAWMQAPELLSTTASEQLTLEEEYANQKSWRDDEKKMTFIVEVDGTLVGDVNLFLNDDGAEVEVMIAKPEFRKKGIAQVALACLLLYAESELKLTEFVSKVGYANEASQSLFTKHFEFTEVSRSEAFEEITFKSSPNTRELAKTILRKANGKAKDETLELPLRFQDFDKEAKALRLKGNAMFEAGNVADAVEFFDAVLEIDPRDSAARSNRSAARIKLGELYGALSDAHVLMHLDPSFPKAPYRLAAALFSLDFADDARRAVLNSNSKDAEGMLKLAQAKNPPLRFSTENPIIQSSFKVLDRVAQQASIAIESTSDPSFTRLGLLLHLWKSLNAFEMQGVFSELCRVQNIDVADAPTSEDWMKLPKGAGQLLDGNVMQPADFPQPLKDLVNWLNKQTDDPLARVASMGVAFECASRNDKRVVAQELIRLAEQCTLDPKATLTTSS